MTQKYSSSNLRQKWNPWTTRLQTDEHMAQLKHITNIAIHRSSKKPIWNVRGKSPWEAKSHSATQSIHMEMDP
jgi:hypothetical protein